MESSSPVNLAFIDACRDNPFLEKLRSSLPATRSTSTNRGLAAVASVKPDTLIMFATEADNVADDGEFENSPFASALLKHVGTPNAEISQITTQIIRDVRIATDFRQNPEVQSAMGVEFYFQRDETLADDVAIEFANAKSSNSTEAWQSFIKRHRSGFFAELAKAALMEIEAGNSSFSQNTDYAQIEKQLNLGSE